MLQNIALHWRTDPSALTSKRLDNNVGIGYEMSRHGPQMFKFRRELQSFRGDITRLFNLRRAAGNICAFTIALH